MNRLNRHAEPDPNADIAEDFEASQTNLDPRRLDVLDKPKRKRGRNKQRKAGPMPERLKPWVDEAQQRALARPASPGVMLEPRDGQGWTLTSPHDDIEAWTLQIADAFGTRSESTMRTFMRELRSLCSQAWDSANQRWKPNEQELNAALNFVNGMRPENEMQAAMAAQMVAMHWLGMKLGQKALANPYDHRTVASTSRVMRAFAQHADTLNKLQGKAAPAKQEITVRHEKHVHHHQHVHFEGGAPTFGGQPDATGRAGLQKINGTALPQGCTALPGPEEAWPGGVPIAGSPGEAGLPTARRRSGRGRTEG